MNLVILGRRAVQKEGRSVYRVPQVALKYCFAPTCGGMLYEKCPFWTAPLFDLKAGDVHFHLFNNGKYTKLCRARPAGTRNVSPPPSWGRNGVLSIRKKAADVPGSPLTVAA